MEVTVKAAKEEEVRDKEDRGGEKPEKEKERNVSSFPV